MKKVFLSLVFSSIIFLAAGSLVVSAQAGGNPGSGSGGNPPVTSSFTIPNPFNDSVGDSLFSLIKNIVDKIILPVGGVLCVLAFIYAGFMYVMAQGDPKQIETANRTLLYASIGTAVLLGSWVLANAICKTIGILGGPICTF